MKLTTAKRQQGQPRAPKNWGPVRYAAGLELSRADASAGSGATPIFDRALALDSYDRADAIQNTRQSVVHVPTHAALENHILKP